MEALKSFKKIETSGNDGLTAEFYLAFWHVLEKRLVATLEFSNVHGQLCISQKQTLIIFLEKKDKDRRFIKIWRPMSLITVDVSSTERPEPFLPEIIHYNQNDFVKSQFSTQCEQLMSFWDLQKLQIDMVLWLH